MVTKKCPHMPLHWWLGYFFHGLGEFPVSKAQVRTLVKFAEFSFFKVGTKMKNWTSYFTCATPRREHNVYNKLLSSKCSVSLAYAITTTQVPVFLQPSTILLSPIHAVSTDSAQPAVRDMLQVPDYKGGQQKATSCTPAVLRHEQERWGTEPHSVANCS